VTTASSIPENQANVTIATIDAVDPDIGDTLNIFVQPGYTAMNNGNGTFDIISDNPIDYESLPFEVNFALYDNSLAFTFGSINITSAHVINSNDAPVINGISTGAVSTVRTFPYDNFNSIPENQSNVVIATIDAVDPDTGDTIDVSQFVVPAGYTVVDNGNGTFNVISDNPIDYESLPLVVGFSIDDGNGGIASGSINLTNAYVIDSNDAPVINSVTTASSIPENQANVTIATIDAVDPDTGDTIDISQFVVPAGYTVVDNGNGTFDIISDNPVDYESLPLTVNFSIDDGNGGVTPGVVNVTTADVVDSNDAPVINSVTTASSIPENQANVTIATIDAVDPDTGDTIDISQFVVPAGYTVVDNGNGTFDIISVNMIGIADIPLEVVFSIDDGKGGVSVGKIILDEQHIKRAPPVLIETNAKSEVSSSGLEVKNEQQIILTKINAKDTAGNITTPAYSYEKLLTQIVHSGSSEAYIIPTLVDLIISSESESRRAIIKSIIYDYNLSEDTLNSIREGLIDKGHEESIRTYGVILNEFKNSVDNTAQEAGVLPNTEKEIEKEGDIKEQEVVVDKIKELSLLTKIKNLFLFGEKINTSDQEVYSEVDQRYKIEVAKAKLLSMANKDKDIAVSESNSDKFKKV
ncbi:hypothetical protein, partial [Cysteiniphilum halobium]|uniref:hypothetical protein n=1 Tax=Cysteiniphilum halobium TaxID=2219059 RepID=UPI003F87DAAD